MEKKHCYGCMELTDAEVCPKCGWRRNQRNESHQLPVGTVLREKYLIGRVLGQGGFGITYMAWDMDLEIQVCVKEFYPSSAVNRDNTRSTSVTCNTSGMEAGFLASRERFLREARSLAKFREIPQIVSLYDFFQTNNTAYMVMEFVKGIDMAKLVQRRGGRLHMDEILRILEPVMDTLQQVHEAGLIHRDISPDNIMLHPVEGAKLLDFGAVRSVENPDAEKELTRSTETILKNGFAPMEQYVGKGSLGPWTDVYAMSATIYYCLTGRIPESAPSRMLEDEPFDWTGAQGITEEQKEVIARGMALKARDRISSVRELKESLTRGGVLPVTPVPEDEKASVQKEKDNKEAIQETGSAESEGASQETVSVQKPDSIQEKSQAQEPDPARKPKKQKLSDPKGKPRENASKEKKKKWRIVLTAVGILIIVIIVLLLLKCCGGPPEQLEWSEWMQTLPEYATDEYYLIEEQTLYRSRELETTSSTTQSEISGWELVKVVEGNGEFGEWSDWAETDVEASENREVETQTRYRFRDKERTTSSSSVKTGWELESTTYSWGSYGDWSSWSASSVASSDSREVGTKTQYRYRDVQTTTSSSSTMSGWTLYDTKVTYGSWSSWSSTPVSSSSTREVETTQEFDHTRYFLAHYCTGNVAGAQWMTASSRNTSNATFNANCVYHALGWYDSLSSLTAGNGGYIGSTCSNSCCTYYIMGSENVYNTLYRSRSIQYTYYFMKYGSWSSWSDTVYSPSASREVGTRTMYRYRDRSKVPTYHFWKWGDWTEWDEEEITATDNRDVETTLFSRYRDRQLVTVYHFQRWSDWMEYGPVPIEPSQTIQVETIKQYRFISKTE